MNKGYKLFEYKGGYLYPLFIDKKSHIRVGHWLPAENHPTKTFATRPGWHIGEIPDAPWLKDATGNYKSRFKRGQRVWCEVEYKTDINYQEEVDQLKKKCFTDRIPEGGYYIFKECGGRNWIIAGEMRVIRILTEEERQQILKEMDYDEAAAYEPRRQGFIKKGVIAA